MAKLVTIFGGSGFVGRYIARRMARQGWRVRVAVRRVNEAGFVRTYGAVGQVAPVPCNLRDEASVAAAIQGADAVVNCVGLLDEHRQNTFDAIQSEGAERIARLATQAGVSRLVHVSAIGADSEAQSDYARTKGEGEAAIRAHFPGAIILRPSIIFGPEDQFFNRFGEMARFSPVVPIAGAKTRFQPVYVDDVAAAAERALTSDLDAQLYELGGPDIETFRQLMQRMLGVIRRRRLIFGMPFWMGRIGAAVLAVANAVSFGLIPRAITRDQLLNLQHDNVVSDDAKGLSDLGIAPTAMDTVLEDYLWRFRPDGQYNEITASAKNLRT